MHSVLFISLIFYAPRAGCEGTGADKSLQITRCQLPDGNKNPHSIEQLPSHIRYMLFEFMPYWLGIDSISSKIALVFVAISHGFEGENTEIVR